MVTRKKAPVEPPVPQYSMPMEVHDWIERANATIQHMRGEIQRMKQEVFELKQYKAWAERRILRNEQED